MLPAFIFLFAGFSTVVVQSLFIRELLVVFQGNELSIGIILSNWLAGTALGNYCASRVKTSAGYGLYIIYALSGLIITLVFFLTRDVRALLGIFPGEGISLKTTFFSSLLLVAPLSAVVGAQFTFAFSFLKNSSHDYPAGSGYGWESVGCFAGGMIFTYLALPFLQPSAVVLLTAALFFSCAALVSAKKTRAVFFAASLAVVLFLPWASRYVESYTLEKLYSGFQVEETVNSPYAQIVSATRNGERYIFSDGIPVLSLPNPDIERSEIFSHLPLLFHRAPRSILILGGASTFTRGALDHGAANVDYAEQDPELLAMIKKYWPENFTDPRLKPRYADGRKFLEGSKTPYDAILVGVPYPVSLPLNRYYTSEFFRLAKQKLSKEGIIALSLPGSLVYVSSAMGRLNAIIKKTVDSVFKHSVIIPGDSNIIIASDAELPEKAVLKLRFSRIADKTFFISGKFIDYSLDPQKQAWLATEMEKYGIQSAQGGTTSESRTLFGRLRRLAGINRDF